MFENTTLSEEVSALGSSLRREIPTAEVRFKRGVTALSVFLQESVDVARPPEIVRERFFRDASWLEPLALAAEEDGEVLYIRVGPKWAGGTVTRKVSVTLGPPSYSGETVVLGLSWRANSLRGLFPVFEGTLELAPLEASGLCRVTLAGSYEPPLGEVGGKLDDALFHHVAHSTARNFRPRGGQPRRYRCPSRDMRQGWT